MNVPNILTALRCLLTLIFIDTFSVMELKSRVFALVVFTLAVVTDFLDGYIARKYNMITQFGKLMDPVADKFLILSAFLIFTTAQLMATWVFVVITVREVAVTALRVKAVRNGVTLAAEAAGKLKTVLQMVAVYSFLIYMILIRLNQTEKHLNIMKHFLGGIDLLMVVVAAVTVWSGASFVRNNYRTIFHVG